MQAKAHSEGDQDEVTQGLKAQNDAIKGSGAGGEGKFPELSEPHLVLSSPAGIQSTTAGSTHIASDKHIALTSGAHTSISAKKSLLASVKGAIRLFAHRAGMRLFAFKDDIDIQAFKHSVNLLAKLDITVSANRITLNAEEEVLINGGTSYTRWNSSGIESGTRGRWVEHAASHSSPGPKSLPVASTNLPRVDLEKSGGFLHSL
ncbi:DUF2345 domain-containing protein [Variovorax humicola]|uniref:DUF2345 domain-containing protein n=2 Tax=Variovorax humicola TaxID=1769758 RepID=A0ABU8WBM2_9BURK